MVKHMICAWEMNNPNLNKDNAYQIAPPHIPADSNLHKQLMYRKQINPFRVTAKYLKMVWKKHTHWPYHCSC
jgi:hypothetical protein